VNLPDRVRIVEVGPRDGLQAIAEFIPTAKKIALIDALSRTGLSRIEATSFVHPKAVPQLADALEVMQGIRRRADVRYRALVPNLIGARRAVESGSEEIDFVLSVSETHNRSNVRKTIKESLKEFELVADYCQKKRVTDINVSIATAFGCPFEGKIAEERVAALAERLRELGASEIILADTTGMANPLGIMKLLEVLNRKMSIGEIAVHFHNTRGAGLANVLGALQCGVAIIEGSIGGLGGCPFAPGATGNVATEDMVNMLEEMGISTGVNLIDLIACAKLAEEIVGEELPGQVMKSGPPCNLHPAPGRGTKRSSGQK
jgi:hydroxymethylglutaryl-CoA lyase